MAFKERRQKRYERYLGKGLLPFEARIFSDITFKEAPYLKDLLNERKLILKSVAREAKINNWSKTKTANEYRNVIKALYVNENWVRLTPSKLKVGVTGYGANPYKMLKDYRKDYIQKNPDWNSPGEGKRKRIRRNEVGDITRVHLDKGNVAAQKARYMERIRQDPERYRQFLNKKNQYRRSHRSER